MLQKTLLTAFNLKTSLTLYFCGFALKSSYFTNFLGGAFSIMGGMFFLIVLAIKLLPLANKINLFDDTKKR